MVEISRRCSSRHGVQASPQQQLALNARDRVDFGSLTAIQKAATRSTKGEGMKSIRLLILLLAGGVFTLNASFAQAQAEIDPDHYEPPIHHVQAQPSPHASWPDEPHGRQSPCEQVASSSLARLCLDSAQSSRPARLCAGRGRWRRATRLVDVDGDDDVLMPQELTEQVADPLHRVLAA
jgi:hypothetical protein